MNISICFDRLNTCNRIFPNWQANTGSTPRCLHQIKRVPKCFVMYHMKISMSTQMFWTLTACKNVLIQGLEYFMRYKSPLKMLHNRWRPKNGTIRIVMEKNRIYFHGLFSALFLSWDFYKLIKYDKNSYMMSWTPKRISCKETV